jgi:hypothetical protein
VQKGYFPKPHKKEPNPIGESRTRQSFIKELAIGKIEVIKMKRTEILNALEKMVEDLYEVGNDDAQYYEQIVGEAMDIVMEYDL